MKEKPVAFYCNGKLLDWNTGNEYHNHKMFDDGYKVLCWVNGSIFKTWIDDDGVRNWMCVGGT